MQSHHYRMVDAVTLAEFRANLIRINEIEAQSEVFNARILALSTELEQRIRILEEGYT
ncbi:20032_t:CDS:2 [Funneliformis geosporum]|uniref:20032_t:CDS:1 n=1 Tax=Funneliformis geosporum TaxID=1117311 RepID=A0A9W4SG53_9GLOM|nr:20032_t:CDS:2 [Funneliformis geosporum]